MTPAQLRRELGELVLRVWELQSQVRGMSDAEVGGISFNLTTAVRSLGLANALAGRLLVAQLTDSDRAQADEAAGRA